MKIRRLATALTLVLFAGTAFTQEPPLPPGFPPPGGASQSKSALPAARDVTLTTEDELTIAGTFWGAEDENAPGVVLLHMFRSDRTAWKPVVKALRARGIAVLAIDMRGHGDSTKQGKEDLADRVAKRDAKLFNAMHHDAAAAVTWLSESGGCDADRIAIAGASVGCSVAIDTARRHPDAVSGVLCMTPGANYLGVDTIAHLAKLPADIPLLLLSHESELQAGATAIVEARPATRLVIYDDEPAKGGEAQRGWAHGTRMFGEIPLVELTVASFVAARTGSERESVVLDGVLGDDEWAGATQVSGSRDTGSIRAIRSGRRVLFGGEVPADHTGLRFEVQTGKAPAGERALTIGPPQVVVVDLAKGHWAWTWGGMGSIPNLPGMDMSTIFGKTQPVLRVVRGAERTTFEGEWTVPAMGDPDELIRLLIQPTRKPDPRPSGGVATDLESAVDLPAR